MLWCLDYSQLILGFADPDVLAKQIVEHFGPGKTQKPSWLWSGVASILTIVPSESILKESGMAVYSGAEEALRVLSKLASYQEYLTARKSIHSEVRLRRRDDE